MSKTYDQAYFDRWYRDRSQRVITPQVLARKVRMVLAVAEFHLGHPVRSVLDVGCGEAPWRAELLRQLPKVDYLGLDASEYVVARFGASRNIRPLRFGQLAEQRFAASVDLLVCADVLHYVSSAELARGLSGFAELCHGLAYLEVMCADDDFVGDHEGWIARTATWYRRRFAQAGFISCGQHCYLSRDLRSQAMALEVLD